MTFWYILSALNTVCSSSALPSTWYFHILCCVCCTRNYNNLWTCRICWRNGSQRFIVYMWSIKPRQFTFSDNYNTNMHKVYSVSTRTLFPTVVPLHPKCVCTLPDSHLMMCNGLSVTWLTVSVAWWRVLMQNAITTSLRTWLIA